MIELKVRAGAAVGAATGLIVWGLVAYIPAFHNGVPEPVVAVIPFALAWAGHVIAAYRAPHMPRPDLSASAAANPAAPPKT